MKHHMRIALIAASLALSAASHAGISVDVNVGVGQPDVNVYYSTVPPAPQVEVIPAPRVGFVWAPGYWNWDGHQHVWIQGRWMGARPGYGWVPPRWVRGDRGWQMEQGRWLAERDARMAMENRRRDEERFEAMRREDFRQAQARHDMHRDERMEERHEEHEERHEERRDERHDEHRHDDDHGERHNW